MFCSILVGVSTDDLEKRANDRAEHDIPPSKTPRSANVANPQSITFTDYDNPFELVDNAAGTPPHITQLSRHAWIGCGGDIYVLDCLGRGHIRVEPVKRGTPLFVV